jgi:hypothetical protein
LTKFFFLISIFFKFTVNMFYIINCKLNWIFLKAKKSILNFSFIKLRIIVIFFCCSLLF